MHLAKFLPLSAPRPRGGNASSFRLDFEPPGLHARDARGSAAAVPPPGGGIGRAQAPQPREGGAVVEAHGASAAPWPDPGG